MDDIGPCLAKEISNVSLHFWIVVEVSEYIGGLHPVEMESPDRNILEDVVRVMDLVTRRCLPILSTDDLHRMSSPLQTLG